MFFGKKKEGTVKKLDRLVMGLIIGSAIASVLGLTMKARKNKSEKEKKTDEENAK